MKRILIFSVLLAMFSCSSVKKIENPCKVNPFEELDSLQRSNQKLNYSISKPRAWIKGITSGGNSYTLQGKFIDSLGYFSIKASVYIGKNLIRETCINQKFTITDYLHYFISYKSKWFPNDKFKYSLLKGKHKIYEDIYIVNYTEKISSSRSYKRSFFLFFKNNVGYTIQYVAEPKNYETYLPEVEKMINSFRILD